MLDVVLAITEKRAGGMEIDVLVVLAGVLNFDVVGLLAGVLGVEVRVVEVVVELA